MKIQRCTLLFLVRDDQILLAMKKRGLGEGRYNGVGGKIEPGETVEQAAIRECHEEIGVTPTTFHKVAELDFLMDSDTKPWQLDGQVFIATDWTGNPIETEEMAPRWFNVADIPYDTMWVDDIYWLPQVLEGQKVKGSFSFDHAESLLDKHVEVVDSF